MLYIQRELFLQENFFDKLFALQELFHENRIKLSQVYKKLSKLQNNKNVINEKKNNLDVFKTHGSNLKLLKFSRKFKFTSFNVALAKTYKWFENNKNLL